MQALTDEDLAITWALTPGNADAGPSSNRNTQVNCVVPCFITYTNAKAHQINSKFLMRMPGEQVDFLSDGTMEGDESPHLPEYQDLPATEPERQQYGLSDDNIPEVLHLKVSALVHLVCNFQRTLGLVTGALATVLSWDIDSVMIRLAEPRVPGNDVFRLPRVLFGSRNKQQFPLRLAFCVTAHMATVLELSRAVVDVRTPGFADHGLLHIALTRVSQRNRMRILANDDQVQNMPENASVATENFDYSDQFNLN